MHISEVQKDSGFGQFFMTGRTMRKILHGNLSTMDSIIHGRDIDNSGNTPHEAGMSRFTDHAGKKGVEKTFKPFRKPGISQASTMDTVIWGRDFDMSGADPHQLYVQTYRAHGGNPAGRDERLYEHRPLRRGAYSMKSTMDDVLFGRDLDKSGEDPHSQYEKTYTGHAGLRADLGAPRPYRKPTIAATTTVDELVFGRDQDMSGPNPQKQHMLKHYANHAGLKSEEKATDRPFRKNGISLQATIDDLVFHHDIDGSGEDPQVRLFTTMYSNHAGRKSGGQRTVARYADPRDPRFGDGSQTARALNSAVDTGKCGCKERSRSQPPPNVFAVADDEMRPAGLTTGRPMSARCVRERSAPPAGGPPSPTTMKMPPSPPPPPPSKVASDAGAPAAAAEAPSSARRPSDAERRPSYQRQNQAIFVDDRVARRPGPGSDAGSVASVRSSAAGGPAAAAPQKPSSIASSRALSTPELGATGVKTLPLFYSGYHGVRRTAR